LWFLVALIVCAYPQSNDTQKLQGDPILGERIGGGVVFEGRLWLRGLTGPATGVGGGLISLDLADNTTSYFKTLRKTIMKQAI
jgi:hypothetical protein